MCKEKNRKARKEKRMVQKQWPVGFRNRKDRFTRSFELVGYSEFESLTSSMSRKRLDRME